MEGATWTFYTRALGQVIKIRTEKLIFIDSGRSRRVSGFGHRFQFELKTMSDRKEGEEGEESVAMADEKDEKT